MARLQKNSPSRTTKAAEDYLERIQELIARKGYARVADVATELNIAQASVTAMVQRLDGEGLLKYEKYRGMLLTDAGKNVALQISHRHQVLTNFLRQLGVDEAAIAQDVEGMEHHISPQTLAAIEALVKYFNTDAHALARAGLPLKTRHK